MAWSGHSIRGHGLGLALSPHTAKALIDQFASPREDDNMESSSQSSNSPDSLYSNGSPVFADQAFEYDMDQSLDVTERDEDEYESLMGTTDDRQWEAGSWGRWPETGLEGRAGWTPSPRSGMNGGRTGSIISISPRGSISAKGNSSRRNSTPSKARLDEFGRRDSDPSLLGFDLARRKSSLKSVSSSPSRRRSSATSSVMDPAEDDRLNRIASMQFLGRRFSEVVEVTQTSDTASPGIDTRWARAALQSPWTPDLDTEDDEDSEIHTAPYVPTPDVPSRHPALLSNYPLPSAVRETDNTPFTPDTFDSPGSPTAPIPPFRRPAHLLLTTPPPPAQPIDIVRGRGRGRPSLPRTMTEYQFPPRSAGVPAGAGPPRPTLSRAVSTPFFSQPQKTQPIAIALERRAAGAFPISRAVPLGVSPLRESTRRTSAVSEGSNSRRQSEAHMSPNTGRKASIDQRRMSTDSRRGSIVAERRISIALGTSAVRRQSSEMMRRTSSDTRRSSLVPGSYSSRNSSITSLALRKESITELAKGATEMRRDSSGSRMSLDMKRSSSRVGSIASIASRKSSVVSIGEYGYLAPQIVIDEPQPTLPTSKSAPNLGPAAENSTAIRRANAPTSIALPTPRLNLLTLPATPSASRFNALEEFLGTSSMTPSSAETPVASPFAIWTPRSEMSTMSFEDTTPRQTNFSIMDRPRPISPPEFLGAVRFKARNSPSSPTSPRGHSSGSETTYVASDTDTAVSSGEQHSSVDSGSPTPKGLKLGVVRKAVPQLTLEDKRQMMEQPVQRRTTPPELSRNYLRRGAVELFTPNDGTLPQPPPVHRRTSSIEISMYSRNPPHHRPGIKRESSTRSVTHQFPSPPLRQFHPPATAPTSPQSVKSPVVSFSPKVQEYPSRPSPQRGLSSSSFSRFFHSRSKSSSNSHSPSPPTPSKLLKGVMKPTLAGDLTGSPGFAVSPRM